MEAPEVQGQVQQRDFTDEFRALTLQTGGNASAYYFSSFLSSRNKLKLDGISIRSPARLWICR